MSALKGMTEAELREHKQGFPKTEDEMLAVIRELVDREHDYGTCVYAMSIAAEAAFNYVAHRLGVTGFQASCADMDFLARSRGMKSGFQILDYDNLLYPQYRDKFEVSFDSLLRKNATHLKERARARLAEAGEHAHPSIRAHWEYILTLPDAEA